MKKKNGCLTAFLIVLGIIIFVGLIHSGVGYYILSTKFELKEIKASESVASTAGGVFGYYVPNETIESDRYQLKYVSLVVDEKGQAPKPIEVVLYDRKAAHDVHVATSSLTIDNGALTYSGHDAETGDITFKGRMMVSGQVHTLAGDLSMEGQTFKKVTLTSSNKRPE